MGEMNETIRKYLEEAEFSYNYNEEVDSYDLGLTVENGTVRTRLMGRDQEEYFIAYAIWDGKVPVRSLPLVLPLLNEINDNTKFTTLSVDPKTGELSCHSGVNTDNSELTTEQVAVSLQLVVRTLDDNIERIMRAAWHSPANADGTFN